MFTTNSESRGFVDRLNNVNPQNNLGIPILQLPISSIKPPLSSMKRQINISRSSSPSRALWSYKPSSRCLSFNSRSPSPISSSSSNGISSRRVFPQTSEIVNLNDVKSRDQSSVVYNAGLTFVMGMKRQQLRPQFQPNPAHREPQTGSAHLSAKIIDFLERTDHVAQEWKRLGHKDPDEVKKSNGLNRSHSSMNIIIKGFQYMGQENSFTSNSCYSQRRHSQDTISESDEVF